MKTICLMILMLTAASPSFGQPREGREFEMSLSGSYQHVSSGSGSSGTGAFLVSPRVGYFVLKGLELEPEIVCMLTSVNDPVYMFNGNISYNFISEKRGVPFVLVGYGIANTIPFFGVPFTRTSFMINVLNVGVGLKVFLHDDVAIRVEYRFQAFNGEGEESSYGYYSYSHKVETQVHSVQFGFSVLL
jgi:hypothetical protein